MKKSVSVNEETDVENEESPEQTQPIDDTLNNHVTDLASNDNIVEPVLAFVNSAGDGNKQLTSFRQNTGEKQSSIRGYGTIPTRDTSILVESDSLELGTEIDYEKV